MWFPFCWVRWSTRFARCLTRAARWLTRVTRWWTGRCTRRRMRSPGSSPRRSRTCSGSRMKGRSWQLCWHWCTMCTICTTHRVIQLVAAQAVGRGPWQGGYQNQTFGWSSIDDEATFDFANEISPGNLQMKSETWLGSRMSIMCWWMWWQWCR